MATFQERLEEALRLRDLTPAELSRISGVNEGAISQYRSGAYKASQRSLDKLSKTLNVSVAWLMGADVPSIWSEPNSADNTIDFPQVRYAGPVAAHFDATPTEEYEYRPIPPEWLGRRKPDDFFVASVDGDSMYPHFQHGDELLCLHCSDMGQSGRIGIMLLGGGVATLKTIEYKPGENWIDLIPANPEYKTRRIEGADLEQCRVVGRVLRVIRTVAEL